MDIIFMGSAGFAVPSLKALCDSHHAILDIVTQPDKPAGRGMRVRACPTAFFAREHGMPLYQPQGVRGQEQIERFRRLAPDLIVVIAYGRILPRELIEIPKHGCINVHASLLPKLRGAAPINWAIAQGERETGVTTMFINEQMDAGDILLAAKTPIGEAETAPELHDRLAKMGADLLKATIRELEEGRLRPTPQNHAAATYAPIIKKDDGLIDWRFPSRKIYNLVRAFTPWPGTFTGMRGKRLTIHRAEARDDAHASPPGSVLESDGRLHVACGEGALGVLDLQIEGGRRMTAADFLRGHSMEKGEVLG